MLNCKGVKQLKTEQFNIAHSVYDAKPWTTGLLWIKIRVSNNQSFGVTPMQLTKQQS